MDSRIPWLFFLRIDLVLLVFMISAMVLIDDMESVLIVTVEVDGSAFNVDRIAHSSGRVEEWLLEDGLLCMIFSILSSLVIIADDPISLLSGKSDPSVQAVYAEFGS